MTRVCVSADYLVPVVGEFMYIYTIMIISSPSGYIAFIHHEGRHTIRKVEIHKKTSMKHKNIQ